MKAVNLMGTDQEIALRHAILIYSTSAQFEDASKGLQFVATLHEVTNTKGRSVIGAGQCLTSKQVQSFAESISKSSSLRTFLPGNVLVISPNLTVWWQPSCVRRIFFVKREAKDFSVFNAKPFRHPPLLFAVQDRDLRVFALAENTRPTPKTKLYRAPYPNVTDQGSVQLCGCKPPGDSALGSLAKWEANFYDSAFSHLANIGKLTRYKGGILALYKHLIREQGAPLDCSGFLIPTRKTVADFVK